MKDTIVVSNKLWLQLLSLYILFIYVTYGRIQKLIVYIFIFLPFQIEYNHPIAYMFLDMFNLTMDRKEKDFTRRQS